MVKINKVRLALLILLLIAFNARAEVTYTDSSGKQADKVFK